MTKTEPAQALGGPWDALPMTARAGAVRFAVHVRPRSSRSAILGVREGALDVALTAPPADGAANAELIKLVARALDVRRGHVSIVAGASSRSKLLEVSAMTPDEARAHLAGAPR
jgi:hypothetical protein